MANSFRAVCMRCRRPEIVCYCRHVTPVDTKTRVVLLQHPRERDVAIGTARMASLCLPNSEIHVGVDWSRSREVARAISDPARPAVLLYPGDGAIDVVREPPRGPVTLVVVDGTWWQARKVVRSNPMLAKLPRYAFTPPRPSEYRIRREPQDDYVSTIEALVHVLGALEGDAARFEALLVPFRAMIDAQLDYAARVRGGRVRHARAKSERAHRPAPVPAILRERANDLVCVVGEANAWPYRCRDRDVTYEDEIVCWAARRLATGETFEAIVRPSHPIAERTPEYTGLSAAELEAGAALDEAHARWRMFVRDGDVVCSWGRYATKLFVSSGGHLPASRVDLRQVARAFARGKVGTLEGFAERLAIGAETIRMGPASCPTDQASARHPTNHARGRAGVRLAQIAAIAEHFLAQSRR